MRQRANLTLAQLAEFAGLGISTIQRAERGEAIQRTGAEAIADILQMHVNELFGVSTLEPVRELIGRDEEWERLLETWKRAEVGHASILLLSGPVGIGKSFLLEAWAAHCREQRGLTMRGAGSRFPGSRFALQPFIDALRPHEERLLEAAPKRAKDTLCAFLAGEGREREASRLEDRGALFEVLTGALLATSKRSPVLLVIDDLQWIDPESIELFAYLAARIDAASAEAGLILVGALRSKEPGDELETLDSLLEAVEPMSQLIPLHGLEVENTRALIRLHDIGSPSWQLVESVQSASDGNPLFIEKILEALEGADALLRLGGVTHTNLTSEELRLPGSLTSSIVRAVKSLPSASHDVVYWGALLGRRFNVDRLAAARDESVAALIPHLNAALEAGLLENTGRDFSFRPSYARQVVYQQRGAPEAQQAHARIAERFQSGGESDPSEIAYHLARADREAPAETVLKFCLQRAELDDELCEWGSAARYYEAALDACVRVDGPARSDLGDLHRQAGVAHHHVWDVGLSIHHYKEAVRAFRDSGNYVGEAGVLHHLVRLSDNTANADPDQPSRIQALEGLCDRLRDEDIELQLQGQILDTLATCGLAAREPKRVQSLATRALEIGETIGDALLCSQVTTALSISLLQQLRVREAGERWQKGLEYGRQINDLPEIARHLQRIPMALYALGRIEEAHAVVDEADRVSRQARNVGESSLTTASRMTLAALQGECALAEELGAEACEKIARTNYGWAGSQVYLALACARTLQGRHDAAIEAIDEMATPGVLVDDPGMAAGLAMFAEPYRALVGAYYPASRIPVELSPLPDFGGDAGPDADFDLFELSPLCCRFQLAGLLQRPQWGEGIYPKLKLASSRGVVLANGWPFLVPRLLGASAAAQGSIDEALSHFALAVRLASEMGATPELVHSHLDWARTLLFVDRVEESRARLREARSLLQDFPIRLPYLAELANTIAQLIRAAQ